MTGFRIIGQAAASSKIVGVKMLTPTCSLYYPTKKCTVAVLNEPKASLRCARAVPVHRPR